MSWGVLLVSISTASIRIFLSENNPVNVQELSLVSAPPRKKVRSFVMGRIVTDHDSED